MLIDGLKWSGKTTTAEQIAKSALYMNNPKSKQQYLALADVDIEKLLERETPRLIDDWQFAPALWDTIRHDVDHRDGGNHLHFLWY